MKITVNVQGTTYTPKQNMDSTKIAGSTKDSVLRHIKRNLVRGDCTYGYGLVALRNDNFVRVYNIEKRRKVVKVVTDPKKLKKGIKREIVTPSHWVATYYDFPLELLKVAKIRVVQGTRTFKIENIK
jgi:hypothetical protein